MVPANRKKNKKEIMSGKVECFAKCSLLWGLNPERVCQGYQINVESSKQRALAMVIESNKGHEPAWGLINPKPVLISISLKNE